MINYPELPQGLTLIPPKTCPNVIKATMELCWKFEPENRCTFDGIVSDLQDTRDKILSQKELQPVEKDDFQKVNEDHQHSSVFFFILSCFYKSIVCKLEA